MKLQTAWYALAVLATTIAATPAPKTSAAPLPSTAPSAPPPQSAAAGFDVTISGQDVAEANGTCHMVYLAPAIRPKLGDRAVIWACVR